MQGEPYWRMERRPHSTDGTWYDQWMPSDEMTYLLGCMMSTRGDIEKVTFARPTLLLLPADKVPAEAVDGGTLYGIPFQPSDKVTTLSLVYPVQARMETIGAI